MAHDFRNRIMRKKLPTVGVAMVCIAGVVGCGSISQAPPPVTAEMTKVRKENGDASPASRTSLAKLQEGRVFFVSRCIECHTLPPVWHYTNKDWPRLVDTMAHRAHLKPDERDAVVAYILAARAL
jgi:mono/diheme cytochrome c family protein